MAEGSAATGVGEPGPVGYTLVSILKKGKCLQYTIPSFPVFTVSLREVTMQWEDLDGSIDNFDGFMRECELLLDHELPALARLDHGYENAFPIEVCIVSYT